MKICDKFIIENAKSKSFSDHEEGAVPFVSNGVENSGVLGFVKPLKGERVFEKRAIVVSSFCEVSIQNPPFLPRGNGGSGLIVLTPKEDMSEEQLYSFAVQVASEKWRFNFGRMVIGDRLKDLPLAEMKFDFSVSKYIKQNMPKESLRLEVGKPHEIKWVKLSDISELTRKYAPYINKVDVSRKITPYVTTTEYNNGISMFCNEKPNFEKGQISISLDGTCGMTFYQFQDFVSGEKTAVLRLKGKEKNPLLLFYIAVAIRLQSWRYHYGRKLSMERLKEFVIPIPYANEGRYDLDYIEKMVKNSYGYDELKKYL